MSGAGGGLPRERREAITETVMPTRAADLPSVRGAENISRALGQQARAVAAVTDPLERLLRTEAGKMAVDSAREEGAAEPLQRDAEGRLQPPDLSRPVFSGAASDARRQVLVARYGSELIRDNAAAVQRWRTESAEDPERFLALAQGGMEGITQNLPAGLRPLVVRALDEQVSQHHAGLLASQGQRQLEETRVAARDAITVLDAEVANIRAAGGDPTEAMGRRQALVTANANILPPGEAARLTRAFSVIEPVQQALRTSMRGMSSEGAAAYAAALASGDADARRIAIITGFEGARYNQRNASGSSAYGRYQITEGFYADLRRMDPTLPEWARFQADPPTQDRAMRVALRSYENAARRAGIPFDDRVALGMHFLGAGGYTNLRRLAQSSPNAPALSIYGDEGIRTRARAQNGRIFAENGRDRTAAEVLATLNARVPNMAGVTEPEMRQIVAIEDNAVQARLAQERAAEQAGRAQRAARAGEVAREIGALRATMEGNDATPASAETIGRLSELEVELDGLVQSSQGDDAVAEVASRVNPRGTAGTRVELDRAAIARRLLPMPTGGEPAIDPVADVYADAERRASGRPLAAQAVIWSATRREIERNARAVTRQTAEVESIAEALAGGPQMTNSAPNQRRATAYYQTQGVRTLMEPQAPAVIAQVAAAGTTPQQVATFMQAAITNADPAAFEQAATIHRAAMRNPAAISSYQATVGPRLAAAYADVTDALDAIQAPEGSPARAEAVRNIIDNSRGLMTGDGSQRARVLGTLGATPAAQTARLAELVDARLVVGGMPDSVPVEMRTEINTRLLDNLAITGNPEVAARRAVEEVTSGKWLVSRYGMPRAGVAGLGGTSIWQLGGRTGAWMENAPERHTAPSADGPSAAWQERFMRDLARGYGARGADWRLGSTAFFRPTDRFAEVRVNGEVMRTRLYEVIAPDRGDSGVRSRVGLMVNGVETGNPLLVPLAARAQEARARFMATATPQAIAAGEAAARREAVRAAGRGIGGRNALRGGAARIEGFDDE